MKRIAQKVLESLAVPMPVGQQMCTLGASIGASIFPRDGETCDDLLGAADKAMYRVKQRGKLGVLMAHNSEPADSSQLGLRAEIAD